MKIAYLSTFYPYRGGIAQFNAALFRALENQGCEVKAFNFKRQYPAFLFPGETQFVKENDAVDKIKSERLLDSVNPLSYIKTSNAIKKFNPEIVISKYWIPFFGPSLGTVLKSTKKYAKNISIVDNAIPHEKRPLDRSFTKYYLNQNHYFITMSKSVENDLKSLKDDANIIKHFHPLYNHFPDKIVKKEARKKLGINEKDRVLLFFGFIRDYKGLDVLIEAMSYLDETTKLIIAGEIYGDFTKYDDLIKKFKLEKRIYKNIRYIDDNEVPIFFSASDLAMLTYKSATQSGILGITYHYEIPVIATDTGGMKEMIEPYNTGRIIEKANPKLISNSVNEFFSLKNNQTFDFKKFKQIASWESLAKKIISLKKS